jgi:hypothetical protein
VETPEPGTFTILFFGLPLGFGGPDEPLNRPRADGDPRILCAHYHARSNVESTFSAMKRKFGDSVRSRDPIAQVNDVLCKALAFNPSILVHAMYELGIEPQFAGLTSLQVAS